MNDYSDKEKKLNKTGTFHTLANHITPGIGPIIRKKSGFDVKLLENWPQIVGVRLGSVCTPFKIKRTHSSVHSSAGDRTISATLMIACDGFTSVKIQHQADEIIEKINQFLGFHAIDKIKIVQRPLHHIAEIINPTRVLSQHETAWLEEQTCLIEDEDLRTSMERLGKNILQTQYSERP